MAQVPEKVLAWLYSVLHVCYCQIKTLRQPQLTEQYSGISRCTAHLLRYCPHSRSTSFAKPPNRSVHLRKRQLSPSLDFVRHLACLVPRRNIPIPNKAMDTSVVPARGADGICYTWTRHDHPAWAARRRRWQSISSLPQRLE